MTEGPLESLIVNISFPCRFLSHRRTLGYLNLENWQEKPTREGGYLQELLKLLNRGLVYGYHNR